MFNFTRSTRQRSRPYLTCLTLPVFSILMVRVASVASPEERPTTTSARAAATRLSLDEALTRAEGASILLRRARGEREVVAARSVGAAQWMPANPLVSFGAGPRREQTGLARAEGLQVAAHAEQTFEIGGQRGTRRVEVGRQVEAARWRESVARVETRARVRTAYVGAQIAAAEVQAAARRVDLAQQLIDAVRTQVSSGAASSVDLELARMEHGRAVRDGAAAELALRMFLVDLRILVAAPADATLELATPVSVPSAPLEGLAPLLARAAQHRAELNAISASREATDATIARLSREALPNPTLFLDFQRDLPGQTFIGAGIALPLPLWRRHQGELAVARAERDRLFEETGLATREIEFEVERAFRTASTYFRMIGSIETEMLPAAETARNLILEGWRAGKFDLFRVIQASRDAAEARRGYLQALGALWAATISLDRAVGTP